jgi:hypothetical protein
MARIGTHLDAVFQALPFAIKREQRSDFEISGCNVEGLGDVRLRLIDSEARSSQIRYC